MLSPETGSANAPGPKARKALEEILSTWPNAGVERSYKLSRGGLEGDRWLIGVDRASIAGVDLDRILGLLVPPEPFSAILHRHLPQANQVGFGFELGGDRVGLKLYLELWDRLVRRVRRSSTPGRPRLLYLGLKWDAAHPTARAIHRYTCRPLLPLPEIQRRAGALLDGPAPTDGTNLVPALVRGLISEAGNRLRRDAFVLSEIAAPDSGRRSFDVNLYKSELRLGDVAERLGRIGAALQVPTAALKQVVRSHATDRLGHLSGGCDAGGVPFVSLYVEVKKCG